MSEMLFKILNADGSAANGGHGSWPLPTQNEDGTWTPGEWLSVPGRVKRCHNGLHLTTIEGVLRYKGAAIFEAERDLKSPPDHGFHGEMAVKRARLLRRCTGWAFSDLAALGIDSLKRVAPVYEAARPGDDRISRVLTTAHAAMTGRATDADIAGAWDAACGARCLVRGSAEDVANAARYLLEGIEARTVAPCRQSLESSVRAVMGIKERTDFEDWQRARLMAVFDGGRP